MSRWIRKGDRVGVIAGNEKGKIGEVLSRTKNKILVQGVNIRKKHQKARSQEQPSQIIEIERPIHISNVMMCAENDKFVKVRAKYDENGNKMLYYKDGENEVTLRAVKDKEGKSK